MTTWKLQMRKSGWRLSYIQLSPRTPSKTCGVTSYTKGHHAGHPTHPRECYWMVVWAAPSTRSRISPRSKIHADVTRRGADVAVLRITPSGAPTLSYMTHLY